MTFFKYLFFVLIGFFVIYTILTAPKKVSRSEARCAIGNSYYNYLKYENFIKKYRNKSKNDALINLKILVDQLHLYNRECKNYSKEEDKLIDDLYKKALMEFNLNSN